MFRIQPSLLLPTQRLQQLARRERSVDTHCGKGITRINKDQTSGDAKKGANANGNSNADPATSNSNEAAQLNNIIEGLTGINLGGLGLRDLPVLEARKGKKKNGTAAATAAAVSIFHPLRICHATNDMGV
jgi:hypothetical protein